MALPFLRPSSRLLAAPLRVAAAAAGTPARLIGNLRGGSGHRRTWVGDGLALLEVRGLEGPGGEALAHALEAGLEAVPGVRYAAAHVGTGRVGVAHDPEHADLAALERVVEEVEQAHGMAAQPLAAAEHPSDPGPVRRQAVALAADAAGLGLGVVTSLSRLTPLPLQAVAAVSAVDNSPRLRGALEGVLGGPTTDVAIAVANAAAQGLAQGPTALVVDAAGRASFLTEALAHRRTWEARAAELTEPGSQQPAQMVVADEGRPVPFPAGPVERYTERSLLAGATAAAAALVATRDPRRATEVFLAGVPKAARFGREGFAAHLGRILAGRGVLVLDPKVLRRLDRIDVVVLDRSVLPGRPSDEPEPAALHLIDRARRGGLRVVVAGGERLARRHGVAESLPGGQRLAPAIRRLQADGAAVAVVATAEAASALAVADAGIAVTRGVPAWTADLLAGDDLVDAAFVLQACAAARDASRHGVALAAGGAGLAAFATLFGPRRWSSKRVSWCVHGAAAAALATGTWDAASALRRFDPFIPDATPWHRLAADEALDRLHTGPAGLEVSEVWRRAHGVDDTGGLERILRPFLDELANPLTPVLAVGAGLSAAAGSAVDAAIVGGLIGINALVGGYQRLRTEQQVAALLEATGRPVRVRRDGQVVEVDPYDLVVGDVCVYEAGDLVAGDCRLLEVDAVEVDESTLTGESLSVAKHSEPCPAGPVADRHCMLYDGTTIVAGRAVAVVVAVSPQTEATSSLSEVADAPPPRGVEARLAALTRQTAPLAVGAGAAVALTGLLQRWPSQQIVGSAVSLAVASVPEGLPFVANVAQLAAARRLAERHALVRNPRAVEALGRTDVLCFDKTGTLTKGRIRLRAVSDGTRRLGLDALDDDLRTVLRTALRANPAQAEGRLGNETDEAVAKGARKAGVDAGDGWTRVAELPFQAGRGYHVVVGEDADGRRLAVKGAPEVLLPLCVARIQGGRRVPLDDSGRAALESEVDRIAATGARVLAVAGRGASDRPELDAERVHDLELAGLLAFAEEVRPSAVQAVEDLRRAGVDVVMITGDHPGTAEGIADELGILHGRRVLTGGDLDDLDDADLAKVLPEVGVFARVTPVQKVRIVRGLQAAGRTVAMTGDGANDAASIRLADCGIAVGKRSSPAARGAADIVVTTNRVETITAAIVEGRAMWGSVRDGLAILVGGNLGEIGYSVVGSLMSRGPALNARQLLLVNLLTDLAPAVAIALRPPHTDADVLLTEGPERSLGARLDREIAVRAVTTAAGATGAFLGARAISTPRGARTTALVALVGTQLGQTLVASDGSKLVLATGLGSVALLAAAVQTPVLSHFFGCRPLLPHEWAVAAGAAGLATATSTLVSRRLAAWDHRPASAD